MTLFKHTVISITIFITIFISLLLSLAIAQAQPVKVVATFSIIADMVQNIGTEHIQLTTLVGADGDAHVYRPTPADAKALARADVVFLNGADFEGWIERLLAAIAYQGNVVVLSDGVQLLSTQNTHDREHGKFDPHAWQDLNNAKIYVKNIVAALVKVDPDNKTAYEDAGHVYISKLNKLDMAIKKQLAIIPATKRRVVSSHNAFAYFSQAYGIEFLAPVGSGTEAEPAAGDIAALIRQIKQAGINAVFVENITDTRLIEQIISETDAHIGGTLYSDALSDINGPASTYIDMFRYNIEELLKAMQQ